MIVVFGMEFFSLRIIRGLVQDPHLSRTAQRLHLTQSALSKRVQNLEEELGLKLFERRGPRGLEPTAAARELSMLADKVMVSWESGIQKITRHQTKPMHFGLVGPELFMREIILPWWLNASPEYPDMHFEAHISALSNVSLDLVAAGMDAGILEHEEVLDDYICKPIFTETWGIVYHPTSNIDSLSTLKWGTINQTSYNPVDDWLVKRQKMPPPVYHFSWDDLAALALWVGNTPGAGTVLPLHAVHAAVRKGHLKFKSLGKDSERVLYLAYRKENPSIEFIQKLLEVKKTVEI